MQSVHITANVVSSNPAQARWFSLDIPVSSTNKTDRHDITQILLKVALNTITLTLTPMRLKIQYKQKGENENSRDWTIYQ